MTEGDERRQRIEAELETLRPGEPLRAADPSCGEIDADAPPCPIVE